MHVEQIQLRNYRNYDDIDITFDKSIHVFTGLNAQGKTNLLEAVFLAVLGKSFRASHDDELIKWQAVDSRISIAFTNKIASHLLIVKLRRGERRINILNGQIIKNKELFGLLNAVLFSPDDLCIVKGSPAVRRRFIDFEISQMDNKYYHDFIKYNRVLMQRNNLLKKINDGQEKRSSLDVWDEQLVELSDRLVTKRVAVIQQLSLVANAVHVKITEGSESFSAHYLIYGGIEKNNYLKNYQQKLIETREKDIRRGSTEIGSHKDDILFKINDYDCKMLASQGQQRTLILSLKLAELELLYKVDSDYPILLLDDVMSELDEKRRKKLMEAITGKIQTFITGTDSMNYLQGMKRTLYNIDGGIICKQCGDKE